MISGRRVLQPPSAKRQVTFYAALLAARQAWLDDGLRGAVAQIDPRILRRQLLKFVPTEAQRILQQRGIRDEDVFPVPVVLETKPTLVGYYRLLTGVGQKTFYRGPTGMGPFARMENEGILLPKTQALLPDFCRAMAGVLTELVREVAPTLEPRDIQDLQLLTLGSNLYGGANNAIGQAATAGVFDALAAVLSPVVVTRSAREISVQTPAGRLFTVALANDPDVAVREAIGGQVRNLLAIEIKGGTDTANVYNRGGEAEKSHQGAKEAGFSTFWTVIHMSGGVDRDKLTRGSPLTDAWFDTAQIVGQAGPDWQRLQQKMRRLIGV